MVKNRPHILKYKTVSTSSEPYQDDDGNWVIPENSEFENVVKCRAEPNGTGRVIAGEDGKSIVYSYTIYLPKDIKSLNYGQKVDVLLNDDIIASGTVMMFSRGQMNSRIWI